MSDLRTNVCTSVTEFTHGLKLWVEHVYRQDVAQDNPYRREPLRECPGEENGCSAWDLVRLGSCRPED